MPRWAWGNAQMGIGHAKMCIGHAQMGIGHAKMGTGHALMGIVRAKMVSGHAKIAVKGSRRRPEVIQEGYKFGDFDEQIN